VMVETWDAQGTTQVKYRGAVWSAVHAPHQTPAPGAHRIQAMVGNRLILERI
jgi:membrane protein implicated in regulation of membrane protease activity